MRVKDKQVRFDVVTPNILRRSLDESDAIHVYPP